jgi:hypothetical protein
LKTFDAPPRLRGALKKEGYVRERVRMRLFSMNADEEVNKFDLSDKNNLFTVARVIQEKT